MDIRAEGKEDLLAEYLLTPGKRYDAFEGKLAREQMFLVGIHMVKVLSGYRRRLLRNKLCVPIAAN